MKYIFIFLISVQAWATDKYSMTDETMSYKGHTLHRIKLLSNNQEGGWIESIDNLSQSGKAWISKEAKVYGSAIVKDDGWVGGIAEVSGGTVKGSGIVVGSSVLSGGTVDSGGMLQFSSKWSTGILNEKKNN